MGFLVPASCEARDDTKCGSFCVKDLPGCDGCFDVPICEDVIIPLPLPVCNPFTNSALEIGDVTEVTVTGSYYKSPDEDTGDPGGDVIVFVKTLTGGNIVASGFYTHNWTITSTESATWVTGVIELKIEYTVAQGTWKEYESCVQTTKLELAPPVVNVTGLEAADPIVVNGLDVTLYFHHSGKVQATKDFYEFDVDWGDGNTETVAVTPPPVSGTWQATHTYLADGCYTITVTGKLDYDDQDPCDQELVDCVSADVTVAAS